MSPWTGLLDDAAVFPPGNTPLADALSAHRLHRAAWYAPLVGPLVLPASALAVLPAPGPDPPALAVTVPGGPADLPAVLAAARAPGVVLRSVEVAVPTGMTARELADRLAGADVPAGVGVVVEVPRDDRRDAVLGVLAGRGRAKFRTGGVRPELWPDEAELAAALRAAVAAGVAFKATAGLHRALRHTDGATGHEQHGFLNVLLATDVLLRGGGERAAAQTLADRDGRTLVDRVRELGSRRVAEVRSAFTAFGTCSVAEPLDELVGLGLPVAPDRERVTA